MNRFIEKLTLKPVRKPRLKLRRALSAIGLYCALSIFITWPLVLSIPEMIPVGRSGAITVSYFNMWTIWWNAESATNGFAGYWDAPIFYPTSGAFAFSEPQPMTLFVAPLVWMCQSRAVAYNLYLLSSLVLNAFFAERLLRSIGIGRLSATLGGALILLLPVVHWQIGVIQLVPLWGMLWTWTALLKMGQRPTRWKGLELGVAFSAACFMCLHHSLFLFVLLAGTAWILLRRWNDIGLWQDCAIALLTAAVLTGPLIVPMKQILAEHEFARNPEIVENLSATTTSYLTPSGQMPFDWQLTQFPSTWKLYPGIILCSLALVGAGFGLCRKKHRRWTIFLCVTSTLAFLLSLGVHLHVGSWKPWVTLTNIVPGLEQVRSVFRFGFFVQMAIALLAAQGLHACKVLKRLWIGKSKWSWFSHSVLIVVTVVAIFEVRPQPIRLAAVETLEKQRGWVQFLRENVDPGKGILCLPMTSGGKTRNFEQTVKWMHWGTYHKVLIANGYSGFFPKSNHELRRAVRKHALGPETLKLCDERNLQLIVISRDHVAELLSTQDHSNALRLTQMFEDEQVTIFEVSKKLAVNDLETTQ